MTIEILNSECADCGLPIAWHYAASGPRGPQPARCPDPLTGEGLAYVGRRTSSGLVIEKSDMAGGLTEWMALPCRLRSWEQAVSETGFELAQAILGDFTGDNEYASAAHMIFAVDFREQLAHPGGWFLTFDELWGWITGLVNRDWQRS